MNKIYTYTEEELFADRAESVKDVFVCRRALDKGILTYSGGSVQERLEINQRIIAQIDAELLRRKQL